jgi:hypothetical protein
MKEVVNMEIVKSELVETRTKILNQFDEYVRNNIKDDNIVNVWNNIGISQWTSDDELLTMAQDNKMWLNKVTAFQTCCIMAGVVTP